MLRTKLAGLWPLSSRGFERLGVVAHQTAPIFFNGELARNPIECSFGKPQRKIRFAQQFRDRGGERLGVIDGHEQSRLILKNDSGFPPAWVATIGTLAAIASSSTFEEPSVRDGSTNTSAAA